LQEKAYTVTDGHYETDERTEKACTALGATVIIISKHQSVVEKAMDSIRSQTPKYEGGFVQLHLSDLESVLPMRP
jgi:hypothetical protein